LTAHAPERSEQAVFVRCARRLVHLFAEIISLNYIDRANIGFATLTMNRDLGFTPSQYGLGAGVFFLGHGIMQVPVSVLMHRIGVRRGLFCIMTSWGLFSSTCAFVHSPLSFYVLRFLLGVAEAGFFPAIMVCLTVWFPQNCKLAAPADVRRLPVHLLGSFQATPSLVANKGPICLNGSK